MPSAHQAPSASTRQERLSEHAAHHMRLCVIFHTTVPANKLSGKAMSSSGFFVTCPPGPCCRSCPPKLPASAVVQGELPVIILPATTWGWGPLGHREEVGVAVVAGKNDTLLEVVVDILRFSAALARLDSTSFVSRWGCGCGA